MRLLVQAVITGFGLKLGGDLYKYVKKRLGFPEGGEGELIDPVREPGEQS